MRHRPLLSLLAVTLASSIALAGDDPPQGKRKVEKTEAEWAEILTPAQFAVCRQHGTEPAFTGRYVNNHTRGVYSCVCCGAELFASTAKFDSGTGWPSFWQPYVAENLETEPDFLMAVPRVGVNCRACGAHLGHVFDDGPPPTGLRYCINSVALKFQAVPKAKAKPKVQAKPKSTRRPPQSSAKDEHAGDGAAPESK